VLRRSTVPLGLLLLAWSLLYLPGLAASRTLPARDVASNQIPFRVAWRSQVLAGHPPLWDPWSNQGRPLVANPNSMAGWPGTALFLVLEPERAAAALIAFHHLALLLGAWVLARRSGFSPETSAIAAAGAALSGVPFATTNLLPTQAALVGSCWALATAAAPPGEGRAAFRRGLLGGSLLGLAFLGGEPITAALGALAWAAVVLSTWRPRPWVPTLAGAGAAVALAAPVLVPLVAVLPETWRGTAGVAHGALAADALAWRRWPELLLPRLLGSPLGVDPPGFWAAPSFPWMRYLAPIFVGALPLMVLPMANRRGVKAVWWWLAAAGLGGSLLLALPTVAGAVAMVPGLGSVRYAIKLLVLPALVAPVLLAAGWDGLRARWRPAGRRSALAVSCAAAVLLVSSVAPERALRPVLRRLYPGSASALDRVRSGDLTRAVALDAAALALPAGVVAATAAAPLASLAAVLAGNAVAGTSALAWDDASRWAEPPAALRAAGERPVLAVLSAPGRPAGGPHDPALASFWEWRAALEPPYAVRWEATYVLARGPDGLEPVRSELLAAAVAQLVPRERARAAAALGATAVVTAEPLAGWPATGADGVWICRPPRSAPPVYLARRLVGAASWPGIALTLAGEGFVAGEDAVVEGSLPAQSLSGGTVAESAGVPHRRTFHVDAAGPGLLVVGQSYMRCWRARIDGVSAVPEPVNGAQLGLRVPAGRHTVELSVDPVPYRLGLLGPLLLAVTLAGSWRGRTATTGAPARSSPAMPPAP
jgi:hypothetical protein